MKILIVDDGVGAFPTLNKLKCGISADYTVKILDGHFPLGNSSVQQLHSLAQATLCEAYDNGFDAVVFSSIALSMTTVKYLYSQSRLPLFGCDIPLVHAGTYTASQVLAVGDDVVTRMAKKYPNVIALSLPQFAQLAESGADEREVVAYVAENAEKFSGSFDCIALGNSSMNLYKNCFSRVFPNARIFDSLDGVARKLHKTFKKNKTTDSSVCVLSESGLDLAEKYRFFLDEFS